MKLTWCIGNAEPVPDGNQSIIISVLSSVFQKHPSKNCSMILETVDGKKLCWLKLSDETWL